jgi:hypothetical protein
MNALAAIFLAAAACGTAANRSPAPHDTLLAALDDPVVAGRDALRNQTAARRYPWYDSDEDRPRRLNLPPPRAVSESASFGLLTFLAWGAVLAALAAVAILLVRAFLSEAPEGAASRGPRPGEATSIDKLDALPFPLARAAGDLLAEARRLYEQGLYGEAMVYLYSHWLVTLDRAQLIRLAKGKTNRQYLRELSARRPLASMLAAAMVAFEDFFFGNHPLDRTRFEENWRRVDEFARLTDAVA